jgi:hypothetical protein
MLQFNQIKIENNFEKMKDAFLKATGQQWNENIGEYCAFVNMKTNDMNAQLTYNLLSDFRTSIGILIDEIDILKKNVAKLKE